MFSKIRSAHTASLAIINALRRHRGWGKIKLEKIFIIFPLAIIRHWRVQLDIIKVLSTQTIYTINRHQPKLHFKYIDDAYLSKNLTTSKRASALFYNYKYLSSVLCDTFLYDIANGWASIYENDVGEDNYSIVMGISKPFFNEGEISLELLSNSDRVFVFSFTIVPGSIIESDKETAIFLTRVQGVRGAFELIKRATKDMRDTSPPYILFAALSGIATALGISCICGVNSANQVCDAGSDTSSFDSLYDSLFSSLGAVRGSNGMFYFDIPLHEKPLGLVKRYHRSRTNKKRQLRRLVADRVHHNICLNRRVSALLPLTFKTERKQIDRL